MARHRQRLNRKALKQDGLLNFTNRAGLWAQENQNLVLGILAGIVVVVLLGLLWQHDARQKAMQADRNLSSVVRAYAMNQPQQVIDLASSITGTSPGSREAVTADYLAGVSALQLGKFAEAEQMLRKYLESPAKMPLYENAAHGALAAALESQNRFAEAATEYRVYAGGLDGLAALRAQLDEARALREAGNVDEAKTLLNQLAAEPQVAGEARLQLAVVDNTAAERP